MELQRKAFQARLSRTQKLIGTVEGLLERPTTSNGFRDVVLDTAAHGLGQSLQKVLPIRVILGA